MVATVTEYQCASALLHEKLLRAHLLLPCISPWGHRASWLFVKCLRFTCQLSMPRFGVAQGIPMHHRHFSVPLLTILLYPTPTQVEQSISSPWHPHLAHISLLIDPPVDLPHPSVAQWWKCICRQQPLQSSAFSPHSCIFTTGQGVSYSALQINQGRFIFTCNFLTAQVFRSFCSACWERGKATYSMH